MVCDKSMHCINQIVSSVVWLRNPNRPTHQPGSTSTNPRRVLGVEDDWTAFTSVFVVGKILREIIPIVITE